MKKAGEVKFLVRELIFSGRESKTERLVIIEGLKDGARLIVERFRTFRQEEAGVEYLSRLVVNPISDKEYHIHSIEN